MELRPFKLVQCIIELDQRVEATLEAKCLVFHTQGSYGCAASGVPGNNYNTALGNNTTIDGVVAKLRQ